MNRYKLSYIMHEPSDDTEDKFMAEIPALPGCRAWGDSPAETLYILEGVAQAFIQSYLEDGQPLPDGVVPVPVLTGMDDEVVVLA